MKSYTSSRLVAAVAAGVVICGGAIATATASNADPSGSATATSRTPRTTSTSDASTPGTSAPGTASTSTSAPTAAHVTVTPTLKALGNGLGKAGYRVDGEVFAEPVGDPFQYTSSDIYVDGTIVDSGDAGTLGADAVLRPIHSDFLSNFEFALAPGKHTVKVYFVYATGANTIHAVTVSKTFTVGSGGTSTAPPATQSSSTQPAEPPTPSPRTTQLGVTG